MPLDERKARIALLSDAMYSWPLETIDIISDDADKAWQLWADYQVKYQDGLMIAAAIRYRVPVFTFDQKLIDRLIECREVEVRLPPPAATLPI